MFLRAKMAEPFFYVLLREIPAHADIRKLYGDSHQLEALAQVLALDSRWDGVTAATLVVRSEPAPVLAVMGYFDAAQRARIESLPEQVTRTLNHLRYVDYQQAERDCQQLSDRLVAAIGKEELEHFHFAGIPRGGLIVLGMLAYTLDLSPAQLAPKPDTPLVVVDDCAISGARFKQFLQSCRNERVVFAPLYAHPALRQAITTRESRVAACMSARDLRDYAPDYYQGNYESWRTRWQERAGDRLYWIGLPEHVCFAWNEPDTGFWNPITEEEELGWRVVPDAFCLKNRAKNRPPAATIQQQPNAKGDLKPAASVLFGTINEQVIVANIETGATLSLTDVAADMWRALISSANFDAATEALLRLYDVDAPTLGADLHDFAAALHEQSILVK